MMEEITLESPPSTLAACSILSLESYARKRPHPSPFYAASPPATPDVRGEVAIWRAVIMQALADAGSTSAKPEKRALKREALAWLFGDSEDFIAVCLYGGFDPDYVRGKAIRAVATGCKWRREPGEGPAPRRRGRRFRTPAEHA